MVENDNTEEQATLFGVLSDPTRLKLLKLLYQQQQPHALCVNALSGLLGVTQSAISQHMRVLKSVGLVKGKRLGYHIHYFVNQNTIKRSHDLLTAALNTDEISQNNSD
jgi:DNA-binding transcriptional ArsR family regulator